MLCLHKCNELLKSNWSKFGPYLSHGIVSFLEILRGEILILSQIMNNCRLIVIFLWLLVWMTSCVPHRKKCQNIQKFHRTGESIAVDDLVHKYEREHQKLCEEETVNGSCLQWTALQDKNLSDYCKKYLQHSVPSKKNDGAIGIQSRQTLHYKKENKGFTSIIFTVQCKIKYKSHPWSYYITRAPESNCVYALKCTGTFGHLAFAIIQKHCDFEEKPLINRPLKRGRREIVWIEHQATGQYIAQHKYLLEYELEHQQMLKNEGGNHIEWPNSRAHQHLDSLCNQYLRNCVPNRNRDNVNGIWKIERFCYQKLNRAEVIQVPIVICTTNNKSFRRYYITKAPENNCVYALLREDGSTRGPMVIVFKHCDFENPKDEHTSLHDHSVLDIRV